MGYCSDYQAKLVKVNIKVRDKNHYVLPQITTEMGTETFIFTTVKLWNSLQIFTQKQYGSWIVDLQDFKM